MSVVGSRIKCRKYCDLDSKMEDKNEVDVSKFYSTIDSFMIFILVKQKSINLLTVIILVTMN